MHGFKWNIRGIIKNNFRLLQMQFTNCNQDIIHRIQKRHENFPFPAIEIVKFNFLKCFLHLVVIREMNKINKMEILSHSCRQYSVSYKFCIFHLDHQEKIEFQHKTIILNLPNLLGERWKYLHWQSEWQLCVYFLTLFYNPSEYPLVLIKTAREFILFRNNWKIIKTKVQKKNIKIKIKKQINSINKYNNSGINYLPLLVIIL